ncbi:hypothetical protein HAX54_004084, partial [Datura stramonium]|nr:hypothetical protein [Datura stramonium]
MKGGRKGDCFSGFGGRQIWVFSGHSGCRRKQRRGGRGSYGCCCFSGLWVGWRGEREKREIERGEVGGLLVCERGGSGVAREIRWFP